MILSEDLRVISFFGRSQKRFGSWVLLTYTIYICIICLIILQWFLWLEAWQWPPCDNRVTVHDLSAKNDRPWASYQKLPSINASLKWRYMNVLPKMTLMDANFSRRSWMNIFGQCSKTVIFGWTFIDRHFTEDAHGW